MRIAISGTHHVGKSTLISDFLLKLPQYRHHEEPYYQMHQQQNIQSAGDFTLESMLEQLEISLDLIEKNETSNNVIFERCPIDFIAYLMHFANSDEFDLADTEIVEYFDQIIETIKLLDLIIFLPLGTKYDLEYCEEDSDIRSEVDSYLKQLYRDDKFNLFPDYNIPVIIELMGDNDSNINKILAIIAESDK